jgi:uncharacterized integral membrane protein (TIGR00697 family)
MPLLFVSLAVQRRGGPMIGWNELIFVAHLASAGVILLGAARLGRTWVTALIVVCTVLMNIAVTKQMTLFGLSVTGSNVLFATVFLANDVLNEHFGKRAARSAALAGFASGIVVVIMMQFVLWYRPNQEDTAQSSLEYFFNVGVYPRIVIVSIVSYPLARLIDVNIHQVVPRISRKHGRCQRQESSA